MKSATVILTLCLLCTVQSARILGLFPMLSKSHYFLGSALMKALAEKGHDVTLISPYGETNTPKEEPYRHIKLTEDVEAAEKKRNETNMFEISDISPFLNIPLITYLMADMGESVLRDKNVQQLINSDEKFDVVIVEQFYNDAHKALATHFNAILILFNTVGANYWVNSLAGNPSPPSYIPDTYLSYPPQMTFCERMTNAIVYLLNEAIHHLYLYPKNNKAIQKYIPNGPDLYDVLYNASLILLNSHPSLNQPVPLVPNMIEIGGFHVKPPKKLPKDLQEFLDNAKDGVIYFSMGSNLRSAHLPTEKRAAILRSFSKLKQKILWKWDEDVLTGQPENVKLGKWLPQQGILAHPNVKLFITHGGLLSTTEAIYFGVPVLAIPIFGDQKLNAQLTVTSGFGLSLPYTELSEETLTAHLNELLDNPKYITNAKTRSAIFHDRPVTPMETALYWIDYVIRHKGAPHLKVAALDLPWYKYLLLDVIAFLSVTILTGSVLISLVCKKFCQQFCTKKKHNKEKRN